LKHLFSGRALMSNEAMPPTVYRSSILANGDLGDNLLLSDR